MDDHLRRDEPVRSEEVRRLAAPRHLLQEPVVHGVLRRAGVVVVQELDLPERRAERRPRRPLGEARDHGVDRVEDALLVERVPHRRSRGPCPCDEDEVRVLLLEPLRVGREVLRRGRHEHAVHLLPGEIAEDVANGGDVPLPERDVLRVATRFGSTSDASRRSHTPACPPLHSRNVTGWLRSRNASPCPGRRSQACESRGTQARAREQHTHLLQLSRPSNSTTRGRGLRSIRSISGNTRRRRTPRKEHRRIRDSDSGASDPLASSAGSCDSCRLVSPGGTMRSPV